jgi:hypothetical protein
VPNVHHNGVRLRIEATAEVTISPPSAEDLAVILALIVGRDGLGADGSAGQGIARHGKHGI